MQLHVAPIFFVSLMVFAGVGDFLTFRIPNWISLLLAGAFVPFAIASGFSGQEILSHFGVAILALIAGFGMFAAGWVGGGDGKLMAAGALWFGVPSLDVFLVYSALAGGICAIFILGWNKVQTEIDVHGPLVLQRFMRFKPELPYGAALAAGALIALPESVWLQAWV